MSKLSTEYLPRWTKREVVESSGRDPLGLSRVSDSLTNYLLPGIITTTQRARYYSFYPWLIRDVETAREAGETVPFQEAFMRRDSTFGLASFLAQGPAGFPIAGIDQITPRQAQFQSEGVLETSFRLLPSNDYGALDQYYASCLNDLGLIRPVDSTSRWSVTERGAELAAAFEGSIEKTPYLRQGHNRKDEVTLSILETSAASFSLDGLRRPESAAERRMLIDILFLPGRKATGKGEIRQQTLGQILDMLNLSGFVASHSIDFALLYSPQYFGRVFRDANVFRTLSPYPPWERTRGLWCQFCAHQYLTTALERFLAAMLNVLAPHSDGLRLEDLVDGLAERDLAKSITKWLGQSATTPAKFLRALGLSAIPTASICRRNRNAWLPETRLSESDIVDAFGDKELGQVETALLLIGIVYGKWRESDDPQWLQAAADFGSELWIGSFLPRIDRWFDSDVTWRDAIQELVEFTFGRHEQVMFQKQRLEASWLSKTDDRFLKEQDIQPRFRSSRHTNALRIFYDLRLAEYDPADETWRISTEGTKLLAKLKKATA